MTTRALFGATGLVGQNLRHQVSFDLMFSRTNAEDCLHVEVDELVICGLPAEKWRANLDPVSDWANTQKVQNLIATMHAEHVFLISTVDVYQQPLRVNEESQNLHNEPGYGLHRLLFERFVTSHFPRVTILRLPALFGPGLKKNYLFDALHENQLENISLNSSYQWYPLERLWRDAQVVRNAGVQLCNFAVEPLPTKLWMSRFFPNLLTQCNDNPGSSYDMITTHGRLFGENGEYMLRNESVMEDMGRFIHRVKP